MLAQEVKQQAVYRLQLNLPRLEKCLAELTEEEVWQDANEHLVSVGNLIQHLIGNTTQYILSGLGDRPYQRRRDAEFQEKSRVSKAALLAQVRETVEQACGVIANLPEERLTATHVIQGMEYSGAGAILHVVEHFSYHTGQITYGVKYLRNRDLGYYAGVDLNQQNQ